MIVTRAHLLDLPRLEHHPANLEAIGEDDQVTFKLTTVLKDDDHDPVALGKHLCADALP